MKECFKCREVKPLYEFYKHKQMTDGHLNKCKECSKVDVQLNRLKNIDKYRAYDRERGNRLPPEYMKAWREKYPIKYKAHTLVGNQVRAGNLVSKPCEVCGSDYTHAHHDDYAEPLNVRWLCPSHHKKWHMDNGEGANAS